MNVQKSGGKYCVTANGVQLWVSLLLTGLGMTDDKWSKKPLTAADRQRLYKERQREAGFRQTTVWIHSETEEEGRQAAQAGRPLEPMESKDPLSWAAGWISEKGKQ
jgi:hypothetical protein